MRNFWLMLVMSTFALSYAIYNLAFSCPCFNGVRMFLVAIVALVLVGIFFVAIYVHFVEKAINNMKEEVKQ